MVGTAIPRRAAVPVALSATGLSALVVGNSYGAFDDDGRIGAGFMPMLAGGLLVLFGVLDLALMSRAPWQESDTPSSDADEADARGRNARQRQRLLVAVFVLLFGTILAVQVVGFLLAFGLLILLCSVVLEGHRVLSSVLVAGVAVSTTYGVFVALLHVPLPTGHLGLL